MLGGDGGVEGGVGGEVKGCRGGAVSCVYEGGIQFLQYPYWTP